MLAQPRWSAPEPRRSASASRMEARRSSGRRSSTLVDLLPFRLRPSSRLAKHERSQPESIDVGSLSLSARRYASATDDSKDGIIQIPAGMLIRVFAISDLHADYESNRTWLIDKLPRRDETCFDVCIVAGDVSDDLAVLGKVLVELRKRFEEVLFCPGNHDLWVARKRSVKVKRKEASERASGSRTNVFKHMRRSEPTSVHKLRAILDMCALHRIRCSPLWLKENETFDGGSSSTPEGGILLVPSECFGIPTHSHSHAC